MELTKLILKNFRLHKELTLKFDSGVVGISGTNGCGKSSIVEAIVFLLTGEGYGKTKAEMLTVGQVGGYVIGHLLIDGKEAILERHIDTAKVHLKYNDTTLKKSSEVNALWAELFQIDKHIVKNVIIANQGEIALLFNGDAATKEKIFQKIFMVPNTGRLQDVIWNNYIKNAPLEYPVKNLDDLLSEAQVLEEMIRLDEEKLKTLSYNEEEYTATVARSTYLRSVALAQKEFNELSISIPSLTKQLQETETQRDALQAKLQLIDIDVYRTGLANLVANKPLAEAGERARASLAALKAPGEAFGEDQIKALAELNNTYTEAAGAKRAKEDALVAKKDTLVDYTQKGISASGECPTCGTKLESIAKLISHTNAEIAELETSVANLAAAEQTAKDAYKTMWAAERAWNAYAVNLESKTKAAADYEGITYSVEDHELHTAVIAQYNTLDSQYKMAVSQVSVLTAKLATANISLAGITKYDKPAEEFITEVAAVDKQIQDLQATRDKIKALEVLLATEKKEHELADQVYEENVIYTAKNKQRTEYMDVLNALYKLFHPTRFPRALIQTYSSAVTEHMNDILEKFDFPYTAKVNESFGIDVFNEEGYALPSISGGQQIMVGFSLRMALHNMFVGAFPFMIIDEGSYGLATDAATKYFEIIAGLNKVSKFKQVIIIDHNEDLADYVDQTITL